MQNIKFIGSPEGLLNETTISSVLVSFATSEGYKIDAIEYSFIDSDKMHTLNKDYLNHSTDTDIITFDYSTDRTILAEVYVSKEMMANNAAAYSQTIENEAIRLVSHALFHCMGYKDKSAKEKEIMRGKEEDFLSAVECIRQLARVCELKYQNSDAEAYYNRCLKSYEDHFKDPEHDRCLDILEELTKFHSRLGDLEKTLKFSKKTFEGYQRKRGIEDKQCLKSLYRYIATLIKLKRWEDALPLGKTCVEMNAKVYGVDEVFKVDHKETKDAKQQLAVIENKGAIAILQ